MKLKCFGIAKEITSSSVIRIEGDPPKDVKSLKVWLHERYPDFKNLNSCLIAVNQEYADDAHALIATDEIALIPPVSGG